MNWRLTMVMLGWLFGNVPDDLRSVLLALREYAEDEGNLFSSAAALVTKQDDESYVADVQTAKYLFDPAEYLNMVASYVSIMNCNIKLVSGVSSSCAMRHIPLHSKVTV